MRKSHKKQHWVRPREVVCVETDERYPSISEAQRQTGISNIAMVLRGERRTAGGFRWADVVNRRREF